MSKITHRQLRYWCEDHDGHFTEESGRTPEGVAFEEFKCKITDSARHGDLNVGSESVTYKQFNGQHTEEYLNINTQDSRFNLDLGSDNVSLTDTGIEIQKRQYGSGPDWKETTIEF